MISTRFRNDVIMQIHSSGAVFLYQNLEFVELDENDNNKLTEIKTNSCIISTRINSFGRLKTTLYNVYLNIDKIDTLIIYNTPPALLEKISFHLLRYIERKKY